MAKQVKLTAERRTAIGRSAVRKLKAQRRSARRSFTARKIKPEPLQVSRRDINAMLSHASGENILVELEIAGEARTASRWCRKCSMRRVGGDSFACRFPRGFHGRSDRSRRSARTVGIANGVKNFGGLLEQSLRSLAIECLPRDLPDRDYGGCFRARTLATRFTCVRFRCRRRDDQDSSRI